MGSDVGNIYPQITQMGADLGTTKSICANLRMDKALKDIMDEIDI